MDFFPVFQHCHHIGLFFLDAVVYRGHHFGAQINHGLAGDQCVVVFVFSGLAKHQAAGYAVVNAELGLQTVVRCLFAGQLQHQ